MTSSNSQMHNDIMAAGFKERPPMLAPGIYAQWKSRFMRYVDVKPNRELLKRCIKKCPHVFGQVKKPVEVEAVHMILNGTGESINIQDVKTKLIWEFDKFTSRDGDSVESYYTRSAKRVKDYEYHKEKMLLCKKEAAGIQLSAEQSE
ncbi:hypothetical protein Tco_0414059 [Tanacetum coccineum]